MTSRPPILAVVLLLVIAGIGLSFRLTARNWGSDAHRVPEEEEFNHLINSLQFPSSVQQYLESTNSPLNPFLGSRDLFYPVYGSLPASMVKTLRSRSTAASPEQSRESGRLLSSWTDLLVLLLVAFAGFRAFSVRVALLAAALYALFPVAIHHSHQLTSSWAAVVPNILLLAAVLPSQDKGARRSSVVHFIVFGILFGLASALDPRNLLLAALLPFLFLVRGMSANPQKGGMIAPEKHPISSPLAYSIMAMLSTWMTWRLFQPYAFQAGTLISFSGEFTESASKILLGELPLVPPLQSIVFTFPERMTKVFEFTLWGFGPFCSVVILLILAVGILPRAVFGGDFRVIALGTVVFSFLVLPLMQTHPDPNTLIFAAPSASLLIADFAVSLLAEQRLMLCLVEAVLLASTLVAAVGNLELFQKANPRDRASKWIAEHLPTGKTMLVEARSVRLPGPIAGRIPGPYKFSEFDPLSPSFSTAERFFESQLRKTDLIVLSSSAISDFLQAKRGEGAYFYHRLENGELHFENEETFTCRSRFFRWGVVKRWVPEEIRYRNCPEVTVYLRKDIPPATPAADAALAE